MSAGAPHPSLREPLSPRTRGFAVIVLLLCGCAHVPPLPSVAEHHRAKTADGVEIALVRYPAIGEVTGPPVLLCHGISANARNMDLDDRISMARYFAAHGRETWTMSMRGAGESGSPNGPIFFDDYWQQDLPAVVAYVKRVSGAPAIHFAGHSMGGMMLYAYLAEGGQGISAAATLGSPTRFDFGSPLEALVTGPVAPLLDAHFNIPTPALAGMLAPFEDGRDTPLERFFYDPKSTDPATFRELLRYGTSPLAGGVAVQLSALFRGRFASRDQALDFRADMQRIHVPILVIAARLDRIGVAPAVKDGFRALGGPKEWLLISRANGTRGEYGHMDLVLGERAAEEVWSKVLDFFDRHARKEP